MSNKLKTILTETGNKKWTEFVKRQTGIGPPKKEFQNLNLTKPPTHTQFPIIHQNHESSQTFSPNFLPLSIFLTNL